MISTMSQAVRFLENQPIQRQEPAIYPKRVYELLKKEGYDPDSLRYIHVAGSKGKGTTARTAMDLLTVSGYNVGLFTSPHIFDIRERIITSSGMIPEEDFIALVDKFEHLFLEQPDSLHFFEMCLFIALVYFLDQKCEFVVLEVGVGGRFDPTNFCIPEISLLTHISMEHKSFLGGSLEQIAYQKSGIIKPDIPAISVAQDPLVKKIFLQEGDVFFLNDRIMCTNIRFSTDYVEFDFSYGDLYLRNLKLHRLSNAAINNFILAVIGIYMIVPLSESVIRQAAQINIFGRMSLVHPYLLVDAAHNGASFRNLGDTLQNWLQWRYIICYVTILEGKELEDIVDALVEYEDIWAEIRIFDFYTKIKRESDGKNLYSLLKERIPDKVVYIGDMNNITVSEDTNNVIVGSFYTLKDLSKHFNF